MSSAIQGRVFLSLFCLCLSPSLLPTACQSNQKNGIDSKTPLASLPGHPYCRKAGLHSYLPSGEMRDDLPPASEVAKQVKDY